jgi:hypothetical protein
MMRIAEVVGIEQQVPGRCLYGSNMGGPYRKSDAIRGLCMQRNRGSPLTRAPSPEEAQLARQQQSVQQFRGRPIRMTLVSTDGR